MELRFSARSSRVDNLVGTHTCARRGSRPPLSRGGASGQHGRAQRAFGRARSTARASGRDGARPAPGSALCSGRAGSQARRRARPGRGSCRQARMSAASTAERLSGDEDELASLRAYVEEGGTRLGAAVTELGRSASTVSEQIAALEAADADVERTLDERIANVAGPVHELGAGLSSALARVTDNERELASVQALAEDGSARLGSQVSELKQQVTAFSTSSERLNIAAVRSATSSRSLGRQYASFPSESRTATMRCPSFRSGSRRSRPTSIPR